MAERIAANAYPRTPAIVAKGDMNESAPKALIPAITAKTPNTRANHGATKTIKSFNPLGKAGSLT